MASSDVEYLGDGRTAGTTLGQNPKKLISFFGAPTVDQPDALTAQLTTILHAAPGTPNYIVQGLTNSSPYGFVSSDEGNTVLSVIANLQARLAQVEARLEELGLIASN